MLCNICFQISQDILSGETREGDHHQSLVSLLNAAEAGCYICESIKQRLLRYDRRDNCRVKDFQFAQYHYEPETQILFSMELLNGQEKATQWVRFFAFPTQGFPARECENIRRRNGNIPEAEAVIKIREWMGLCLRDHEGARCRNDGTQPSSYPSRLLELNSSSFRVLRTAVSRPRGPYVTLSYCWGPSPTFLRLTAKNERELEAGVPISRLPLAFREAISVIQGLSFQYLWIDAVCIMQSGPGSAEDWEVESARMHQIYTNSTLTLALSCAASPHESILNQDHTRMTATPPFEIRAEGDHGDPVYDALTIVPVHYFDNTLYGQPLGHRAWALQERVMATRVVSFGLGELFWDCSQLPHASESIPGGLQATQVEPYNANLFQLSRKSIPDGSDYKLLLKTWHSLLEEYTKRRLTYPKTDRLVALSAIAHDIGQAMDDVYVAGHFWKTLPASLLWVLSFSPPSHLDRYGGRARRVFWSEKLDAEADGPRTPSWSWASLDGPVFQHSSDSTDVQLADAVSYTLEVANQANPTGACISASITIRTYCTELVWQGRNKPVMMARTEAWALRNVQIELDLDEPEVIRVIGTRSLMVAIKEQIERSEWVGLVVEAITNEEGTKYRRIGHFVISDDNIEGSTWWDERFSVFGGEKRLFELV